MFKIKKQGKPGECSAVRCADATANGTLCPRHLREWDAAGRPELALSERKARTSTAPGADGATSEHADLVGRLTRERHTAQEILRLVHELPLDTVEQLDQAGAFVKQAKDMVKAFETERKSVTGKLLEAKRAIDGWFRPVVETYEAIEKGIMDRVHAKLEEHALARSAALVQIQEGAGVAPAEAYQAAHAAVPAPENVSVHEGFTFEITDPDKLAEEWWRRTPDLEKIRAYLSAAGDLAYQFGLIPGVLVKPVFRTRVS